MVARSAPQLTQMPSGPSSAASALESPAMPCLLAQYAGTPERPTWPIIDPTLTILPQPRSRMPAAHSRASTNGPTRLARSTCSNRSVSPRSPDLICGARQKPRARTAHRCLASSAIALKERCCTGQKEEGEDEDLDDFDDDEQDGYLSWDVTAWVDRRPPPAAQLSALRRRRHT